MKQREYTREEDASIHSGIITTMESLSDLRECGFLMRRYQD
jgi:hypothetical protein